ncbi:MAG TPA: hypothetical protein VFP58_05150 [Candidatus Eisenbacteria bacterium]|nr:hypothetical protein [Candidatus Eisenbacteria bacterium]
MNRAHWAATAFAGIALLGASLAGATTVQKFTVRDLAKLSESIVLARVVDETARMDEGSKEIYTYVTLRVIEGVKGSKRSDNAKNKSGEETITIRQLGGAYGKYISVVPGMPTFRKGEEVVVFLSQKDRAGYPWVMGLQQGKYSVTTDDNGFKQVRNDMDGLTVVEENGLKTEVKGTTTQPLASFLDGIKTQLDLDGKVRIDDANPTK